MARYTTEFDVDTSPETVFTFLEDFTNAADWDAGVADAERLDDGPIGVGSRFGLDLLIGGQTQRWVYEVEQHEPNEQVTFATRTKRATGIDIATVVANPDGGSHVSWDATFRFNGPFGALIDPAFNLVFQRIGAKAAAGLRPALAALAFNEVQ
jgi:carbon monoxide dehydrogenase subunit G